MKLKYNKMATFAATLITFGSLAGGATAAIIITVTESGSNVIATSSGGSLNLSSLTYIDTITFLNSTVGALNSFLVVGASATSDRYTTITSSGAFGSGPDSHPIADFSTGPQVGAWGLGGELWVPGGYVSGASLSASTSTWNSQTLSSLDLTEGVYTWSWGGGANSDSITVNITTVPEPSTAFLFGLSALGLMMRRSRTS